MIREDYTHNDTKKSACHHLADDEDFVRRLVQGTLNEVLESEMTEFLGAGKSERTKTRQGYRSGYYRRDLTMKVGEIELRVPQERSGQFSTQWHSFSEFYHSVKDSVLGLGYPLIFYSVSELPVPVLPCFAATFRPVFGIAAHRTGPDGAVADTGRSR